MDLPDIVDAIWKASVPIELVPDIVATLVCGLVGIHIIRVLVYWRPRLCLASFLSWALWLGWNAAFEGYEVLEATHRRWLHASEVTERFAQNLVELVKSWTDFFLPFLSDVSRWLMSVVRTLSLRQRMLAVFGVLSLYSLVEGFRFVRSHRQKVMWVLFHASFLLGGPVIWYVSGFVSSDWLEWTLWHMVSTVPTLASMNVLSCTPDEYQTVRKGLFSRQPVFELEKQKEREQKRTESLQSQRSWLSFWVCWPILALLQAGLNIVPRALAFRENSGQIQFELRRATLTAVVWLQWWEGSKLLQFSLETLLSQSAVLDVAGYFGAKAWCLSCAVGMRGAKATGSSSWRMMQMLQRMAKQFWLIIIVSVIGTLVVALLVWLFYSAVSVMSAAATLLVWCFAAADSADTLTRHVEDFYAKKLSFWVLAMLWEALASMPYFGIVLRLFTPVAFSVWLVAGETVLRRVCLPIAHSVRRYVCAVVTLLYGALCARREDEQGEEEVDGDEEQKLVPQASAVEKAAAVEEAGAMEAAAASEEAAAEEAAADGSAAEEDAEEESSKQAPSGTGAIAARDEGDCTGGLDDTGGTGVGADAESEGNVQADADGQLRNRRSQKKKGKH